MIKVKCPKPDCGKIAAVKEEYAGKKARCPACGTIMSIPNVAAAPAPPSRPPEPPPRPAAAPPVLEEEQESYEEAPPRRKTRSGQVTAIAIVNFVLGGLSIAGGLCISVVSLVFQGLATARPKVTGVSREQAEKIAQGFATVGWVAVFLLVIGIISLIWGAAAVADGVGLLKQRKWGRQLALVLGGIAGVLGLASLVPIIKGDFTTVLSAALYIAYAFWVFLVLTRADVAQEFS